MTKILLTGASGYLGHHVTDLLQDSCIAYDNLTYVSDYLEPVPFVRGDVTDYTRLQPQLDQVDVVVWLAAIVGDGPCMVNPTRAIAVNQGAVKYLAENYSGSIIFCSTASCYGTNEGIATVHSELCPLSLYAETKIKAEEYLAGKDALILRLGTLHGKSPRMRFDLVVNKMTLDAVQTGVINVFGGHQYRPLLSVKDAAGVIARQARNFDRTGIFNLASENLSIQEVAEIVSRVTGAEIHVTASAHEDNRDYRIEYGDEFGKLEWTVEDSSREIMELLRSGRLRNPYASHYSNTSMLKGNSE